MVMSLGLPAVQSITSQQINSTTRKFTGLIRTLRNDAILLNLIHRIGIDLDNQTWWVEQQKRLELLSEAAEEEDGGETPGAGNFGYADKYSTEPKPMPAGVVFSGVLTERFGLIKEGVVYIHFFPNGFVEQSILYLSKSGSEDVYYSLILRPTSGKVEIQPGAAEAF